MLAEPITISEQVAIAGALVEKLASLRGVRHDASTYGQLPVCDKGETRELAAAKAGLGSGAGTKPGSGGYMVAT